MIDTAGRLQNKGQPHGGAGKKSVALSRVVPDAPHETLLALDASTGQNALVQAKRIFKNYTCDRNCIDQDRWNGSRWVVLAIREELDIPVKLIGFGEKIDDIGPFHSENFMRGLFGRLDLRVE